MNLLLVDDERIAVQGMLRGVDWKRCGIDGEILTAYNARQAMAVLEENPVSLILCDIEMPGENGIQLLRQVSTRWPKIACILLTCHAEFTYAQEALRLGCLDYILKPAEIHSEKVVNIHTVQHFQRIHTHVHTINSGMCQLILCAV